MIRCVAFDFGEVLASSPDLFLRFGEHLNVDPAAFERLYWADRASYDAGLSEAAYWQPILAALDRPTTPEVVQEMTALDTRLWLEALRPEALALMADVREAGRLVAVVSNAPFALDVGLIGSPIESAADFVFISASMGVSKPSKSVFFRVAEVTELAPDELAFIDDRPENVHAARESGWEAHLFVNDADTRAWLVDLGVLA